MLFRSVSQSRYDAVGLQFYADNVESVGYGGAAPVSSVQLSGMYVSSVSYTVPVEGNATESVTLVGNNKSWAAGSALTFADNPFSTNSDTPIAITGSGGVNRRENVILVQLVAFYHLNYQV